MRTIFLWEEMSQDPATKNSGFRIKKSTRRDVILRCPLEGAYISRSPQQKIKS